jgi:hypothetical protein
MRGFDLLEDLISQIHHQDLDHEGYHKECDSSKFSCWLRSEVPSAAQEACDVEVV